MRQYLSKWEIFSQSIINQYVLFLMLGTIRLYLSMQSLLTTLGIHRAAAMVLCQEVQKARAMADQVPEKTAQVVALLVQGFCDQMWKAARLSLLAMVVIIKDLIAFFIDIYLGTLTCLLTATIRGILDLVADILREITQAVETVVNGFIDKFQEALSSVSSVINTIIAGVDAIKSLFSSDNSHISSAVNKLNLTISDLNDIHISTKYTTKIEALADEIPNFSMILSNVTDILTLPLTKFSNQLEQSFSVSSNFTLPEFATKKASYSPCTHLDTLLARALSDFQKSITYATIGLCTLTVSVILVSCVLSFFKNKSWGNLLNELSFRESPVDIGNALQTHEYGVMRYLVRNLKPRILWLISFMTTSNLMSVLAVALIGAITALVQYCLICGMQSQLSTISRNLTNSNSSSTNSTSPNPTTYFNSTNLNSTYSNSNFADSTYVVDSIYFNTANFINSTYPNSTYFNSTNSTNSSSNSTESTANSHFLNSVQDAVNNSTSVINTKLLGGVHSHSEELVNAISTFQTSLNDTIFSVFGTSFLAEPFETIVYCTVGRKIDSIKKGIVWIQNNTRIDPPQIYEKDRLIRLLSYSPSEVDTINETVGVLQKLLSASKKSILVECYISAAFFGIWLLYLCAGIAVVFWRERRPAISWPSRMAPDAQKQYQYPFNDLGEKL